MGPGIEHQVIVTLLFVEYHPVGLQTGLGRTVDFDQHGLTLGQVGVDLGERGGSIATQHQVAVDHLRIKARDRAPDDGRAYIAAARFELGVERFGRFGVAMPADQHRHTGNGTTDVTDGLAAFADLDRFPGRVLLRVVDEGEGHMITFYFWVALSHYIEKYTLM